MSPSQQVAVPEGMFIATNDFWRPGQNWSVPEGEDIAFLEDSYYLVTLGAQVFQNWCSLAATGRF